MIRGDKVSFTHGTTIVRTNVGFVTAANGTGAHEGLVRINYMPFLFCENLTKTERDEHKSIWVPRENVTVFND